MESDSGRTALLLRGPQCSGKTEVGKLLDNGRKPLSLDDYNYEEQLQTRCGDDLLVLELGYGEDRTRKPHQWLRLLNDQNRRIIGIYLTADLAEREKRGVASGRNVSTETIRASDELHRTCPDVVNFARNAGIDEQVIDTTGQRMEVVAEEIRKIIAPSKS
jgi:hypothetical protein